MEAAILSSSLLTFSPNSKSKELISLQTRSIKRTQHYSKARARCSMVNPNDPVSITSSITSFDPTTSQAEITWQIVVGGIAGVTPFVVAGIEFSKRIIAQRKCKECGGSGLILIEKDYCRCPECGGFLPWQSWKRFFSG